MARLETLEMIERFISIDTVSRNSNLALIEFARVFLQGCGAETSITFDRDRRKANLLATVGPRDRPGIVLSGHSDVVPVDGQVWTSDPFTLARRGERILGRGVCDMKGFLAIATAAIPRLVTTGLDVPIHIAMSYDEEVGCLGVHDLIDDIRARAHPPRVCMAQTQHSCHRTQSSGQAV
jgi:acetylornithine deacetylase